MAHTLPDLPYAMDALAPHISKETLEYHYGKHHQAYVNNLNAMTSEGEFSDASLEEIIQQAQGGVFNNAAQIWNHTFYWHSLSPNGGGEPNAEVKAVLDDAFGSVDTFKDEFTKAASTLFGSGWTWLVKQQDGKLAIKTTKNADTPITDGDHPLMVCDVWEHAYYVDYRNARPKYIEAFWALVNWDFIAQNLAEAS